MPHGIGSGSDVRFTGFDETGGKSIFHDTKKSEEVPTGPMSENFDYRSAFGFVDPNQTKEAGFNA